MLRWIVLLLFSINLVGQNTDQELDRLNKSKQELLTQIDLIDQEIESLKFRLSLDKIKSLGLPSNDYIEHSAIILSYSEEHEQAKWVSHMILPEIKDGVVFRTNDFRIDPKVITGTAIQQDYFLTDTLANGEVEYDGYGYDRGHLAPSADFRWSKKALSESYYYSNMSPQDPELNREGMAELESLLRDYVIANEQALIVITAPVLDRDLKKLERSPNGLTIPEFYIKIALDLKNERAIAFILPNKKLDKLLSQYATSIDEVEKLTGFNFFPNLKNEAIESSINKSDWFENLNNGDVEPLDQKKLPPGHFNTLAARNHLGSRKEINVCGKVVASRYSRSGNLWLNLDINFPNQIFSVFIRKKDLKDFPYNPKQYENKTVCFRGKIEDFNNTPTINVDEPNQIFDIKID